MLLLSADTSGKHGSIALARGEPESARSEVEVIEIVPLAGGTFSAQLVPQIAALLAKHGMSKSDIGAFAVATGPGSFTGLRVGLAAIKALAEILGKPIAAVSLLEAVAVGGWSKGSVVAVLDAGRGEIFCGEYDVDGNSAKLARERILSRHEFLAEIKTGTVVTPDTALAEAVGVLGVMAKNIEPISAAAIARVGWQKIQSGDTVSPDQLDAIYIRRSDAIFSKSSF